MSRIEVLIRPIVTEKSTTLAEQGKYVFLVDKRANAQMIKEAVEEFFSVKVKKVNIGKVFGKKKRVRYNYTKTPTYKKAIVTLYPGYKIDLMHHV
ncbi:MAG: 50S ribosomal protein L23 [Caldisericaceae bacterium]|nr:50S ribosomal protein L23 [Caldisericaceae bacterium]